MITFNQICKQFQSNFWEPKFKALDDVSFTLEKGSVTGFLGANGAGKTTTLKILMNFISQTSGEIHYDEELGKGNHIFEQIGYLPERPYFYPFLTGREFLNYLGEISDVSSKLREERILEWSRILKLDHALDRKVRSYSKGMLQRLGFISTVLHDPKLIILDEPLSGLDPIGRNEFKKAIKMLNAKGKTIFFSSHIVPDIEEICQNVLVIEKGKKIYDGNIETLINNNMTNDVTICFQKGDGKISQERVTAVNRESILAKLIAEGASIVSVTPQRKSLEEIVYEINR